MAMPLYYGNHRRRLDEAFHAGRFCSLEHPQGSLDCRPDQVIFVFWLGEREGGGKMGNAIAALDRLSPSFVGAKIGFNEFEP